MKFKRDNDQAASISQRFSALIKHAPGTVSGLSLALGYTKPSTLYAIRDGKALPDILRLQKLAEQNFGNGLRPNIHWLVTGNGDMFLDTTKDAKSRLVADEVYEVLQNSSKEKIDAVLTLLDHVK